VILLHGQPGSALDWHAVVPLLRETFDVITPDRPGYGHTGGRAVGFAANAAAVVDLLDHFGVEQTIVVGHSWGGGVALALAEHYASRVAGLVLISSVSPGEHFGWADRLLAAPVLGESVAAATIGAAGRVLGSRHVRSWSGRYLPQQARDAVHVLAAMTGAGTGTTAWRSFVVEQRALLAELESFGPGLAKIETPTAVVHGSADHVVPPAVARHLVVSVPGATRITVTGAGHMLPHDHPRDVAAAVRRVAQRSPGLGSRAD
jgi:pimeloyl-ACP methyl ester carboxylesterase